MDTEDINIDKRKKHDHNRACFQNILSFVTREENKMKMDELKIIVDKLFALNIIVNADLNGKDSFRIVKEETHPELSSFWK